MRLVDGIGRVGEQRVGHAREGSIAADGQVEVVRQRIAAVVIHDRLHKRQLGRDVGIDDRAGDGLTFDRYHRAVQHVRALRRVAGACADRDELVTGQTCFSEGIGLIGCDFQRHARLDGRAANRQPKVVDSGVAAVVVDDFLDKRDRRRRVVIRDRANRALAFTQGNRSAFNWSSLTYHAAPGARRVAGDAGLAEAVGHVGPDVPRQAGLVERRDAGVLDARAGEATHACRIECPVAGKVVAAIVVDDFLDKRDRRRRVVIRNRAGGGCAEVERDGGAGLSTGTLTDPCRRAVAGRAAFAEIVAAGAEGCTTGSAACAGDGRRAVCRQCPVGGNCCAAVVRDDDLDQRQAGRDVVVGDGAGLGIAIGEAHRTVGGAVATPWPRQIAGLRRFGGSIGSGREPLRDCPDCRLCPNEGREARCSQCAAVVVDHTLEQCQRGQPAVGEGAGHIFARVKPDRDAAAGQVLAAA